MLALQFKNMYDIGLHILIRLQNSGEALPMMRSLERPPMRFAPASPGARDVVEVDGDTVEPGKIRIEHVSLKNLTL